MRLNAVKQGTTMKTLEGPGLQKPMQLAPSLDDAAAIEVGPGCVRRDLPSKEDKHRDKQNCIEGAHRRVCVNLLIADLGGAR